MTVKQEADLRRDNNNLVVRVKLIIFCGCVNYTLMMTSQLVEVAVKNANCLLATSALT